MSNANPSYGGQINLAGDQRALYLKVFAGEVEAAFRRVSAFRDRHIVRVIPNGKSAQFPITGRTTARYHTPGAEILGQAIGGNERIITVEDLLISDVFLSNLDEMLSHFELRSIYSGEIGQALAKQYDKNVARTMINAARGTAAVTGLPDGAHANDADFTTDGGKLWAAVFNAGVTLDANDVPFEDRYAWFRPVQYALIVRSEKPINRDLNPDNGSIASGRVNEVNSIPLIKTNNLVSTDDRAATDQPSVRQKDYSVTTGLVAHRSAAGTVQLQDITMESMYDMRRQGTLMIGKYLTGHDKLRTESAYEIRTGDPS